MSRIQNLELHWASFTRIVVSIILSNFIIHFLEYAICIEIPRTCSLSLPAIVVSTSPPSALRLLSTGLSSDLPPLKLALSISLSDFLPFRVLVLTIDYTISFLSSLFFFFFFGYVVTSEQLKIPFSLSGFFYYYFF